jgi:tetratricopeptide (TPR) repeat protein
MERKRYFLVIILLLSGILNAGATYKERIYNAYISSRMGDWKNVIDEMEGQATKSNGFMLELLNYQYGYIGWAMGNDNQKEARKYLDSAERYAGILESRNFEISMVNAYKSAFYGFRIGLNRLLAPVSGPKSVNSAKLAISIDENNPMGYIQLGNTEFHRPPVFGGSKKAALDHYLKALDLMEQDKQKISRDWNYLNLLTLVASAYEQLNDLQATRRIFEKILKTEPSFLWVKNELYPDLLKKTKQ